MSDEQAPDRSHGEFDAADLGFEPFSGTEVKCETCGMNIVRERGEMSRHRDFHAAAEAVGSDPVTP